MLRAHPDAAPRLPHAKGAKSVFFILFEYKATRGGRAWAGRSTTMSAKCAQELSRMRHQHREKTAKIVARALETRSNGAREGSAAEQWGKPGLARLDTDRLPSRPARPALSLAVRTSASLARWAGVGTGHWD